MIPFDIQMVASTSSRSVQEFEACDHHHSLPYPTSLLPCSALYYNLKETAYTERRGDNETLKTCTGANRRFYCGGLDFQKRDDFCPINQHRLSREGTFVVAIRVLLADDSEDILAELREDLSKEFDIVGTARNGEEAVQAVLHVDPAVFVAHSQDSPAH